MATEALSPPNPMQSLRERLIQEGFIVPSPANAPNSHKSISELAESIKEKIERHYALIVNSRKSLSALEKAVKAFADRFFGFESTKKSSCSYFGLLGFLNFHRILEVLLRHQDKRIESFLFVRAGFFFAFKENMKNTP